MGSWCAAMSVEEPETGVYGHTACRVVENLQKIAAINAQVA